MLLFDLEFNLLSDYVKDFFFGVLVLVFNLDPTRLLRLLIINTASSLSSVSRTAGKSAAPGRVGGATFDTIIQCCTINTRNKYQSVASILHGTCTILQLLTVLKE